MILSNDYSYVWEPRLSSRSHRRYAKGDRRALSRRAVEVVADRFGLEASCKLGEGQGGSVNVAPALLEQLKASRSLPSAEQRTGSSNRGALLRPAVHRMCGSSFF